MKKSAILFFLCLLIENVSGQEKYVWWRTDSSSFADQKIISVRENSHHQIIALGTVSFPGLNEIKPSFSVLTTDGNLIFSNLLNEQVSDVRNFVQNNEGNYYLTGSRMVSNQMSTWIKTVDSTGVSKVQTVSLGTRTVFGGDIQPYKDSQSVWAQTIAGKNGFYNVQLIWQEMNEFPSQVAFLKLNDSFNSENLSVRVGNNLKCYILNKKYTNSSFTEYYPEIWIISQVKQIEKKQTFPEFSNFSDVSIAVNESGQLFLFVTYKDQNTPFCRSSIVKMDSLCNNQMVVTVDSMIIKGAVTDGDKLFVYGGNYIKEGMYIVEKGKIIVFDKNLKEVKSYQSGMFDEPDAVLPGLAMSIQPTSSEFLSALRLSNGNLAFAGRVFMPDETTPDKILLSGRHNRNFLVIFNKNLDLK